MSDESTSSTSAGTSLMTNSSDGGQQSGDQGSQMYNNPTSGQGGTDDQQQQQGDQKADEKGDKSQGAPDQYADFTLPEGVQIDKGLVEGFKPIAKELNLTQDQAQKLVDYYNSGVHAQRMEQWAETQKSWVESAKADKEFGGQAFNENMGYASSVLDKFGTPELRKYMDDFGVGNNPEMIRFVVRIGKAMAEPQHVSGGSTDAGNNTFEKRAQSLYSNSNMK